MELLLDTHAFLWWVAGSRPLPRAARAAIADPGNSCRISLASCWEMAIKVSLGKLRLPAPLERFIPEQMASNGFRLLEIDLGDIARVATLPFHHRDPFDRLLAAQALDGGFRIVSADRVFQRYGVARVW
ncbi:MAG: type II toxin-antitoxin system VapC family toxin [Deltaproteobacteria bacterium]|nr:type II toxin-antitoxin system VapC family toxin [Deltaproteobacteria bacterium]